MYLLEGGMAWHKLTIGELERVLLGGPGCLPEGCLASKRWRGQEGNGRDDLQGALMLSMKGGRKQGCLLGAEGRPIRGLEEMRDGMGKQMQHLSERGGLSVLGGTAFLSSTFTPIRCNP